MEIENRNWVISFNKNRCTPQFISAIENADTPKLTVSFEGVQFNVEFMNRSDYFSARHGQTVQVHVVSRNRSKIVKGTAINQLSRTM